MPENLQEFLNENSHRNYPIQDDLNPIDITSAFTIPTGLIVDMQLAVPYSTVNVGTYFISSVTIRRYTVDVTLSYKPDAGVAFVIGSFLNLATSGATNQSYAFLSLPDDQLTDDSFADMTGTIVIGTGLTAVPDAGAWEFLETATALNATVMDEGLTQVRSIQIDNQKFYGNVIFKEGTNVSFTPIYDAVTDTTTVTIAARLLDSSSEIILDNDADVMAALIDLYGPPIVTINNIEPDASGNFDIVEEDCITVTGGTNSILVNNNCSTPCCDGDYLDDAYTALNQVNIRYAHLVDFHEATTSNIDQIQQRLGLLEAQTGYF